MAVIAIDFDGTLADHRYPKIGFRIADGIETCLALQQAGHKLILLTMRSGDELKAAVRWCTEHGLGNWFGINENPEQENWSKSRKVYAQVYIDDAALGCPLVQPGHEDDRPCVDWPAVQKLLRKRGLLGPAKRKSRKAA